MVEDAEVALAKPSVGRLNSLSNGSRRDGQDCTHEAVLIPAARQQCAHATAAGVAQMQDGFWAKRELPTTARRRGRRRRRRETDREMGHISQWWRPWAESRLRTGVRKEWIRKQINSPYLTIIFVSCLCSAKKTSSLSWSVGEGKVTQLLYCFYTIAPQRQARRKKEEEEQERLCDSSRALWASSMIKVKAG